MSELPPLHVRALESLDMTVDEIREDQWASPTPCEEWDVRQLLGHLTREALWVPHLLRGETLEEVGDRYEGEVLGQDPRGSWLRASAAERATVTAADAVDGSVHTSMGEIDAEEYLTQRLTDLVVHRWDLAKAIGADTSLDPEASEMLYEKWEEQADMLAGSGMFAEPVPVPDSADAGTRLLALLGRRA